MHPIHYLKWIHAKMINVQDIHFADKHDKYAWFKSLNQEENKGQIFPRFIGIPVDST